LGDVEATAVPNGGGRAQLVVALARSQKFPYERQTPWESNALRLPSTSGAKETRQE